MGMNPMTSKKSWLLAPVISLLFAMLLVVVWAVLDPQTLMINFDNDGRSPVELMTLPLFALIVPLVWLCPPVGGSVRRQVFWNIDFSLLGVVAVCREEDLHKAFCHWMWPDLTQVNFNFKMKFFMNEAVPLSAKVLIFVLYVVVAAAVLTPLIRYLIPLFIEFFRMKPVAWTTACFGGSAVISQLMDGLDGKLAKMGISCTDSTVALFRAFEEGGEMLMALLALLAILQSHLYFNRQVGVNAVN